MTAACGNNLISSFQNLSDETIMTVFRFCPFEYLFTCASVCIQWKNVIYESNFWPDISTLKSDVAVIDAAFWTSNPIMSPHFKEGVIGAPPLNKLKFYQTYAKVIQLLKKEKWEIEHEGPRFTLMLIPKNYCHEKLTKLYSTEEWPFSFHDETKDTTLNSDKEAYWVFLPNGILVGSRKKSSERDHAIETAKKIVGSRFPKQAEIGILVFASDAARIFEALNGDHLDDVATGYYSFFTEYCKEVNEKKASIGDEAKATLQLTTRKITISIYDDEHDNEQKDIVLKWLPYSCVLQFNEDDEDMYTFCMDERATNQSYDYLSSKVMGFSVDEYSSLKLCSEMLHEKDLEYQDLLIDDAIYGVSFAYEIV